MVGRELRSYGYSYSQLNGELRSYQEFPNHILDCCGVEFRSKYKTCFTKGNGFWIQVVAVYSSEISCDMEQTTAGFGDQN